jgi:hypothetical protein
MPDTTATQPPVNTAPKRPWYVLGVDFGHSIDHTALALIEADYKPKPTYRLRGLHQVPLDIPYSEVCAALEPRLTEPPLAGRITLALDATGVGTPVIQYFAERLPARLPIYAITITGGNEVTGDHHHPHVPKRDLVSTTRLIFERQRIRIAAGMRHTDTLIEELVAFRRSTTEHGNDTYNATAGRHDDLVIAPSLALWTAEQHQPPDPNKQRIFVPRDRLPTTDDILRARLSSLYGGSYPF